MAGPSSSTPVLAIEGGQDATGWRKNAHLIDCLPYVDPLGPEEKRKVESLIEEEMRNSASKPSDFLKELPPLPQLAFQGHPVLQTEYTRVRRGEPMARLDTSRYSLNPPPASRAHDPAAWQEATENAGAQLEHQRNRVLNLELLRGFGAQAWHAHNAQLAATVESAEKRAGALRKQCDEINRKRKLAQEGNVGQLDRMSSEWADLVKKNFEIEVACARVEAEIAELRARVPKPEPEADAAANGDAEDSDAEDDMDNDANADAAADGDADVVADGDGDAHADADADAEAGEDGDADADEDAVDKGGAEGDGPKAMEEDD